MYKHFSCKSQKACKHKDNLPKHIHEVIIYGVDAYGQKSIPKRNVGIAALDVLALCSKPKWRQGQKSTILAADRGQSLCK